MAAGESYVAGGSALNEILRTPRRSGDIGLFHDTTDALAATFAADRDVLLRSGFAVEVQRETPSFVQASSPTGSRP